uniref:Uncharacterized protein n=1 Tax=Ditylenchus dipsaci TaxID=166011 RepID=A0A915CMG7_9BILA
MEVDDEESSSLSDIDEEAGQDSDYEDFPQARFVNPVAQPDAYVWLGGQQQLVGGASMQNRKLRCLTNDMDTLWWLMREKHIWGGRNDEFGSSQLLHQYNPATNEWSVVKVEACYPRPEMESNHRFSQETYAFDFKTNTWHQVNTQGDPPQHRDFHTACVLDSKMYIFGGRSDEMGQHHSSNDNTVTN